MTLEECVVVDLETTGLDYKLDRILEIGAVRLVEGRPVAEFQTLVAPGVDLRAQNVAIHGITPELIAGAPSLEVALSEFLAFLGTAPLVAHNATFDANFLRHHASETLGVTLDNPVIDTHPMAREVFPHERALSLEKLLELHGEPPRPLHRALADAQALAAIFPRLLEAQDQRRGYHRSQFPRIAHVASRYRELGRLIELMQTEFKDLRQILEVYFEEEEAESIALSNGMSLKAQWRESHEFHADETKEVLSRIGLFERVVRLDREKLDRFLLGDRLDDTQKAELLATRRYLGRKLALRWEAGEPDSSSSPKT